VSRRICVAGKFDPCHDGHINHILKASRLGDYLVVITHPDKIIEKERRCNIPLWARIITLEGVLLRLGIKGEVIVSVDTDGTVAETLRMVKPDIFAKGGDRSGPNNMPQNELEVCQEIGCEIVYGIGEQLNQSSKMELAGRVW